MPYTQKQHNLFMAAAHNPQIAAEHHIPQAKAAQMASEGIKHTHRKRLAKALRKK